MREIQPYVHNEFLYAERNESNSDYCFQWDSSDWDERFEKFLALETDRGYADITSGTVVSPDDDAGWTGLSAQQRASVETAKVANVRGYHDLQVSTNGLSFRVVRLANTTELAKDELQLTWGKLQMSISPKKQKI